jgi:excisionase family DNA binding protein
MSAQNRPGILEAARLAGVSRWTIHRMVASGKLTATEDRRGRKVIDPAELMRVFGDLHPVQAHGAPHGTPRAATTAPSSTLVLLEMKLESLERERDRLRDDLDRERQEKTRLLDVLEQQQRLLSSQPHHQQQTPAPEAPARPAPAPERPPRRRRRSTPKKSAPTPTVAGEIAAALERWLRR